MSQPAKLADVAQLAGVSLPTASQVMNDAGRVAPATRERVRAAAKQLNYRPNALARSVASGSSKTIGILAENAAGAFCMPVLIGVNRALSRHDLVSILFDAEHDKELRAGHVQDLIDRRVDGLIVIGEGADVPIAELGEAFAGPVVHAFGPQSTSPAIVSISTDEMEAGRLAARRFLEMGRRNILHVTADAHLPSVQARQQGFIEQLEAAGVPEPVALYGNFSREWGVHAGAQVLQEFREVDAIFAGSDAIAIGLAATLEAGGVSVPRDVALIGFDHISGYGSDERPYLESIDPQLSQVGRTAADHMAASLKNPSTPPPAAVSPRLVPGATTRGELDQHRERLVHDLLISERAPHALDVRTSPSA